MGFGSWGLAIGITAGSALSPLPNPQPPTSTQIPAFEVASIKLNRSGIREVSFGMPGGGRFTATNAPLREIIRVAYGVSDYLLVDAPNWIRDERYDIVAKGDVNAGRDQLLLMLRSLLAERVKLSIHRETRELPQYAIVMAKADGTLGPRLRPAAADCPALLTAAQRGIALPKSDRLLCGYQVRPNRIAIGGQTLEQIAGFLWPQVQRVVINRTSLQGRFDADLDFAMEPPAGATALTGDAPPSDLPSIFTAFQEQLGLKLEPAKGPMEVLVVDRVERPSED